MSKQLNNSRLVVACAAILTALSTAVLAQQSSLPDAPASQLIADLTQDSASSTSFAGPPMPAAPQNTTQQDG